MCKICARHEWARQGAARRVNTAILIDARLGPSRLSPSKTSVFRTVAGVEIAGVEMTFQSLATCCLLAACIWLFFLLARGRQHQPRRQRRKVRPRLLHAPATQRAQLSAVIASCQPRRLPTRDAPAGRAWASIRPGRAAAPAPPRPRPHPAAAAARTMTPPSPPPSPPTPPPPSPRCMPQGSAAQA